MLDRFCAEKSATGVSPKTIRWYQVYVVPWIKAAVDVDDAQAGVFEYLKRYDSEQTRKTAWRAIRGYERWLCARAGKPDWTRQIRLRFRPAKVYPVVSEREFLRMVAPLHASPADRRDRRLFTVLYYTGARLEGVRLLKPCDVDLDNGMVQLRTKGGVNAPVALPAPARRAVQEQLQELGAAVWLWPSSRSKAGLYPISASWLSHRLPVLAREAGIKKRVWVHGLRHACATELVNRGVALEVVQRQLLHRDIATTQRYVQVAGGRVAKAIDDAWKAQKKPPTGD